MVRSSLKFNSRAGRLDELTQIITQLLVDRMNESKRIVGMAIVVK